MASVNHDGRTSHKIGCLGSQQNSHTFYLFNLRQPSHGYVLFDDLFSNIGGKKVPVQGCVKIPWQDGIYLDVIAGPVAVHVVQTVSFYFFKNIWTNIISLVLYYHFSHLNQYYK